MNLIRRRLSGVFFVGFFVGVSVMALSAIALITASATAVAQEQAYRTLDAPLMTDGDGVEVREFFSYACPHCADFEPQIRAWTERMGDQITVVHTPVTFGRNSWEVLARAYFAADALGIIQDTHTLMFQAIHQQGRQFSDAEAVAEFYASVADVSEQDVVDAMNSFSVTSQINQANRLVGEYGVPGTPAVAVAGKYLIDVRAAGGQAGMLEVAESLVSRESE
ncbi:thiol:disulfide interchange protein DsbA/DsbL [Spiribacter salilacus]|nr:thiol:disulfide interchange protein DsbA/DsbL [Spiribacter salilacus]